MKTTKRALFSSVIALILCFSMLVGTTFAWFTDSVESGVNQIIAGNLDVDVLVDGNSIQDKSVLFDEIEYWEPGVVAYENLTVVNLGTLALKYQLSVNFTNATTNAKGETLAKVLKVGVVEGGIDSAVYAGEAGRAKLVNELQKNDAFKPMENFVESGELEKQNDVQAYGIVIWWEPSVDDNDFNNQGKQMRIDLGVKLVATQLDAEFDSFGDKYDEDAIYYDALVKNDAELLAAIQDSEVKVIAIDENVTYNWGGDSYANSKALLMAGKTFYGVDGNETITFAGYGSANPIVDVTLKDITVKDTTVGDNEAAWEHGHLEFESLTANNVVFADSIMLNGDCTLTNCSMNNQIESWYGLWIEGGNTVIRNCSFTGTRAIKVHEANGSEVGYVVIDNNEFVSLSEKPGVAIGNVNAATSITLTNNLFAGTQEGDQKNYKYESDTDVANFNFIDESNTVYSNAPSNSEDLKNALTDGDDTIYLPAGNYTFPGNKLSKGDVIICDEDAVFEGNSKLNINGATVIGATFSNPNGTAADQTINGIFKNCVFEGKNGLRWCYAGDTVVFEDCVFSGSTYGVHFDGGANKVVFRRCTISGFNAMGGAVEMATFEDCTFKSNGKSGYNGINMWGSTEMIGCTFVFDDTAGTEWVDACGDNKTYTFTNCIVTDGKTEKGIETVVGNYGVGNTIIINGKTLGLVSDEVVLDADLAAGKDVVMTSDMKFNASQTTANSGYGATGVSVKGGVLDGNGHSLGINNWGTWDAAVHTTGGTIKNLTINSGMRGIFMGSATADVYIDNVTIDGTIYTFNSDGGNKEYGVYISNSTLNGWTSHSDVHKEVVYTNCSFGEGQGYAFCRPYGPTQFIDCDFEDGYELDARGAVTFENCTIGGVALTAENLATLVTSNIGNANVK